MDVVERNFMRLLRSGTFGDRESIEPMSEWKWKRLYQLSLMHGVTALVGDGIRSREGEFFMNISDKQKSVWTKAVSETESNNAFLNEKVASLIDILNREQLRPVLMKGQALASLYPNPLHRTGGDCDIYFPYEAQGKKADKWARINGKDISSSDKYVLQYTWEGMKVENHHRMQKLTNIMLNNKLQSIINAEIRCCDSTYLDIGGTKIETLPPTLNLLIIIIRIARYILSDGISLKQVIDLGVMLRTIGAHVDFVKLQQWISSLKLGDMAHLEGSLLTQLFGFSESEIPFMNSKRKENITGITNEIFNIQSSHTEDWYFTQGKSIFVRTSNSSALFWHINHSRKYFRYYPSETVTNFFSSFAHSLSHIEE